MMSDKRMRRGVANILLSAAAVARAIALATVLTGGFSLRAMAFSSRDPWRPFVAGLVVLAVARGVAGADPFRRALHTYIGSPAQRMRRLAVLIALSAFVFACAWTSRAAGGSDSSCYVLQAEA